MTTSEARRRQLHYQAARRRNQARWPPAPITEAWAATPEQEAERQARIARNFHPRLSGDTLDDPNLAQLAAPPLAAAAG